MNKYKLKDGECREVGKTWLAGFRAKIYVRDGDGASYAYPKEEDGYA